MLSDSTCFKIIAFTIIAKKKRKIVESFVFCSVSPVLHQHKATFMRRLEVLLHVLISQSLSASVCSAVQQMTSKQVIYRGKALIQTLQLFLPEMDQCVNLPLRFMTNAFIFTRLLAASL